jgi:GH15 family glucan-1,4-alpha-glucosidase
VCALAYRALKCLADLEQLAGSPGKAGIYKGRAQKIREAYLPNFFNPETGIIAGWRDAEGKLHDYWFTFVNGIAITQGLVPDDMANGIVDRIEAKMKEVGFDRFDLGLPGPLVPIRKNDYGAVGLGHPEKEDGTDAWQVFENGGATACFAGYYVQALYKLGRREEAERILWPMMKTYADGGFQNGVGHGGEWRRWDGTPSGYEGMLADAYQTQLLLFTGHYGIGFGSDGFYLEPWSPLRGKRVPLGLKCMGRVVDEIR